MDPFEHSLDLLDRALELKEGPERYALIEDAVRFADLSEDLEIRVTHRIQLIEDALSVGRLDRAIVELPWCVHQFNTQRELLEDEAYDLLWAYKNVLCSINDAPQISLSQFDQISNEMAVLYTRCGYNMRPVHYCRMVFYLLSGDRKRASEHRQSFLEVPRDPMAHCHACERDTEVDYHLLIDEPDKAIKQAEPIISGRLSCASVPHTTYAALLRPLAMRHDYDLADEHHRVGYRLVRGDSGLIGCQAQHLAYLTHRDKLGKALRILERNCENALATFQFGDQYRFCLAAQHLLEKMASRSKSGSRKIKLARSFPLYQENGSYSLGELASWFEGKNSELARKFDDRNQSDYFSTTLRQAFQY